METRAMGLVAHRLTFCCQATTALSLPSFSGASVRGALLQALRMHVCALHGAGRKGGLEWMAGCPVCDLMAPVDREAHRGQDVVRLFTVEPPLEVAGAHPAGWNFSFGLTLFGPTVALFPYLAVAVQTMGQIGFGQRDRVPGRFRVYECWADDPFGGRRERIMEERTTTLSTPSLPITDDVVRQRAQALLNALRDTPSHRITVRFLTPARLITEGRLSAAPDFPILIRRVLRRVSDLCEAACAASPAVDFQALMALSESVRTVESHTRWVDLTSHSNRTGRTTPIGGLMGDVVYEGIASPFLHWLLWSEVTHVGKDTTKGNGMCRIVIL